MCALDRSHKRFSLSTLGHRLRSVPMFLALIPFVAGIVTANCYALPLMIVVALSITGVINRTRAILAGRKGLRFCQHIYNVGLQLRKGAIYSTTTTALFRIAPCVYLGAAFMAFLFIPHHSRW